MEEMILRPGGGAFHSRPRPGRSTCRLVVTSVGNILWVDDHHNTWYCLDASGNRTVTQTHLGLYHIARTSTQEEWDS